MKSASACNLGQLFAVLSELQPGRPALVWEESVWSFGELNAYANRLVHWLLDLGLDKPDVVAIQLPKCLEAYALAIACLKLGAIYVFIDVRSPAERTAKMLARCQPRLLVTTSHDPVETTQVVRLRNEDARLEFRGSIGELSSKEPDTTLRVTGADAAYIMFTSGSTGEPKGAVIPHMGVMSLIRWAQHRFGIDAVQRLTNINPIHFDNSVFDIYCGLFNGASIVPIETSTSSNPHNWARIITELNCSIFFAVPTLFMYLDTLRLLNPERFPTIRTFVFGGEGYPRSRLQEFFEAFHVQARLVNVYGPTETSCICSSYDIDAGAFSGQDGFPPLGPINPDFDYIVVGDDQEIVAAGEIGELWLGGPCIGLGYHNNPEATKERFRQDPRHESYRSVWYRTGDLVAEDRAAGYLLFKGRADNQVKVRGHRIELEEIENVVVGHAGVKRSVAIVRRVEGWDEIHVVLTGESSLDLDDLVAYCKDHLPAYMLPNGFTVVDDLPLNPNGKIDRRTINELMADRAP